MQIEFKYIKADQHRELAKYLRLFDLLSFYHPKGTLQDEIPWIIKQVELGKRNNRGLMIAYIDSSIVGYLLTNHTTPSINAWVLPQWRKMGIGTAMIRTLRKSDTKFNKVINGTNGFEGSAEFFLKNHIYCPSIKLTGKYKDEHVLYLKEHDSKVTAFTNFRELYKQQEKEQKAVIIKALRKEQKEGVYFRLPMIQDTKKCIGNTIDNENYKLVTISPYGNYTHFLNWPYVRPQKNKPANVQFQDEPAPFFFPTMPEYFFCQLTDMNDNVLYNLKPEIVK